MYILPPGVDYFPHPSLSDKDGFLAIGGHLSESSLLLAYQFGIFPWNNPEEPLLWWSTQPRFVLFPDELKIAKSMRPYLNGNKFTHTIDTAFSQVINNCGKSVRKGQQGGTWLTEELTANMCNLHEQGYAHSIEVWKEDELVGGLYGLSLGKMFFGESMFATESNASKYAFIKLVQWLKEKDYWMIDCQQETGHLGRLGARLISHEDFHNTLRKNIFEPTLIGNWSQL